MAHDFAKQRSNPDNGKRKRAASRPAPPGSANWSWFFSGLMTGVIVSIAAYLAVLKLEENVAEDAQVAQAGTNPEDGPSFTYGFYDRLTNAEVAVNTPNTAAATTAASPATAEPPPTVTGNSVAPQTAAVTEDRTLYLLQAGSFQNKQGAESRRTSLLLLNMNANISEGIVGGRTLYSVQAGPFVGKQSAEEARALLSSNDIESIRLLAPQ